MADQEQPPLEIVLALDTSLSMAVSDPRRLVAPAVGLLLNLLPPQSHVQVLGFDKDVHGDSGLRPLDDSGRRELAQFAKDVVIPPHLGTDFRPPFEAARQSLTQTQPKDGRPLVLLFSDGIVNVGTEKDNQRLKELILEQTVPQLNAADIRVYAVAFSEHVDSRFLQEIAERTGGLAIIAEQADQLSELFTSIFELIEQPDMLPVGHVVHVDEHVSSLSLLLNRQPEAANDAALISPQGDSINAESKLPGIRWTDGNGYSLVTMDHPQQGNWQLPPPPDPFRKAYIATDLALHLEAPALVGEDGPLPRIRAWLERSDGSILQEPALHIRANIGSLKQPAPPDIGLELLDDDHDGRFEQILPELAPGSYRITVQAEAGNLRRIKKQGLTVAAAPEPAAADGLWDTASLSTLAWINLALLPIIGAVVYFQTQRRKQSRQSWRS